MERKAKGRRDDFGNFDGLVQQRIEMTLRCAPVISILWWLGSMVNLSLDTKYHKRAPSEKANHANGRAEINEQ